MQPARARLGEGDQLGPLTRGAPGVEHSPHDPEVDGAHHFGLFLCRIEQWAPREPGGASARVGRGLEAQPTQQVDDAAPGCRGAAGYWTRRGSEPLAPGMAGVGGILRGGRTRPGQLHGERGGQSRVFAGARREIGVEDCGVEPGRPPASVCRAGDAGGQSGGDEGIEVLPHRIGMLTERSRQISDPRWFGLRFEKLQHRARSSGRRLGHPARSRRYWPEPGCESVLELWISGWIIHGKQCNK